jgi:hypothetical protein
MPKATAAVPPLKRLSASISTSTVAIGGENRAEREIHLPNASRDQTNGSGQLPQVRYGTGTDDCYRTSA